MEAGRESWAVPAAYGDFIAGIFALIAMGALVHMATWALAPVWKFNIWGVADLLLTIYKGQRVNLEPGSLGAWFYIVPAIAPPLLVSHALIFTLLLQNGAS